MLRKFLPASLLATTITTTVISVSALAGQSYPADPHAYMHPPMPYHGYMQQGQTAQPPARLGVAIAAIPQAELDAVSVEYGVKIIDVRQGSVAEKAGLKSGDLVTEIDGRPVYSPQRMQYLVANSSGESAIALIRDNEPMQLQAVYAETEPAEGEGKALLGIRMQELTEELKQAFGAADSQGILISQVMNGSPASQAGLKAGDVVVSIGGASVTAMIDIRNALDKRKPGETVDVSILRNQKQDSLQVVLGTAPTTRPNAAPSQGMYGHGFHTPPGMMPKSGCPMEENQRKS